LRTEARVPNPAGNRPTQLPNRRGVRPAEPRVHPVKLMFTGMGDRVCGSSVTSPRESDQPEALFTERGGWYRAGLTNLRRRTHIRFWVSSLKVLRKPV